MSYHRTAISLPASLFEEVERFWQTVGMSRRSVFAEAVQDYLAVRRRRNVADRIKRAYAGHRPTREQAEFTRVAAEQFGGLIRGPW